MPGELDCMPPVAVNVEVTVAVVAADDIDSPPAPLMPPLLLAPFVLLAEAVPIVDGAETIGWSTGMRLGSDVAKGGGSG